MYAWYQGARVRYAYLSGVELEGLAGSRWFSEAGLCKSW
jgi:hypothetical protein